MSRKHLGDYATFTAVEAGTVDVTRDTVTKTTFSINDEEALKSLSPVELAIYRLRHGYPIQAGETFMAARPEDIAILLAELDRLSEPA